MFDKESSLGSNNLSLFSMAKKSCISPFSFYHPPHKQAQIKKILLPNELGKYF
jgi:hypothetical protein